MDGVERLREAIAEDPRRTDLRWSLASALFSRGELEQARSELLVVTQQRPVDGRAHALLGSCEAQLGRRPAAIAALERAVALSPRVTQWQRSLATCLYEEGAYDRAEELLMRLVTGPGVQAHDLTLLARIHFNRGEWRRTLDLLRSAADRAREEDERWLPLRAECEARLAGAPAPTSRNPRELSETYYDTLFSVSKAYALPPEDSHYLPAWEHIIDGIAAAPIASVVDIGCGPGQFASLLLSRRSDIAYTGIDFSRAAIERAQALCPVATFIHGDVVRTPVLDTIAYDAAVATEFLEHVEDDLAVIARLRRGTRFFGTVPDYDSHGHVRHFSDNSAVLGRYRDCFTSCAVRTIPTARGRHLFAIDAVV